MSTKYKKIIFVCRDNIYLSPMAEIYFKNINNRIEVVSKGTVVMFMEPYSVRVENMLRENGLEVEEGMYSMQLMDTDFGRDVLVLTVSEKIKLDIYDEFLNAINVYTISEYVGEEEDIMDPYGKDDEAYKECFSQMRRLLLKVSEKIKQED